MAKPSKGVINKNQFNVLNDKDINTNDDSDKDVIHGKDVDNYQYDPIKSGDEYDKSKSYKLKQQKSVHKKNNYIVSLKLKIKSKRLIGLNCFLGG